MRIRASVAAVVVAVGASIAATPVETGSVVGPVAGVCDELDAAHCLLPFPSDAFTVADPSTATGRRVDLSALAMPRNVAGKPVDPAEWNRNDGFSPGSMLLTHLPELSIQETFGLPEGVWQVDRPALSVANDAPIVLVDAETGERVPYLAEVDMHHATPDDQRLLIIRPLTNLAEGHRYVVGLRDVRDVHGSPIPARGPFVELRDGTATGDRADHFDDAVFPILEGAGVQRASLVLAWDFTVASADNLAGRILSMRDEAFAALGDEDLADLTIDGIAPAFEVRTVEDIADGDTLRRVTGAVTIPNYLTIPQDETRTPRAHVSGTDVPRLMAPGSRLHYDEPLPGPGAHPSVNPLAPTMDVPFTCNIPATATTDSPARPLLYGHGLLGSQREINGGSGRQMRAAGYMTCAVDWHGMASEDLPTVAAILADVSNFPSLADRSQQGILGQLLFGRLLAHPDGLTSHEAFAGITTHEGLVFDGNSQGGIMGGAVIALSPDLTRGTLGVNGMNYSTLLNRSVDWEGAYAEPFYAAYRDVQERQVLFALMQMLWDRAETNGYAHHVTDDPYPNTPEHQVLMQVALGDYQVTTLAAEVEARTIGARRFATDLAPGRHWADDPLFGFETIDGAHRGSALVYFDAGNPVPPSTNVPPLHLGRDPHEHPRRDPDAARQKAHFFATGEIVDVHDGRPYWLYTCPVHSWDPGCIGDVDPTPTRDPYEPWVEPESTLTLGLHASVTGAAPLPSTSFAKSGNLYWRYVTETLGDRVAGYDHVRVAFADDEMDPAWARRACHDLTSEAFLVFALLGTDTIHACGQYTEAAEVPYLSAGAGEEGLDGNPWYFASSMTHPQQSYLLASYVARNFPSGRAGAIINDGGNLDAAALEWERGARDAGLDLGPTLRPTEGDGTWYRTYARELRDAGVDVVYVNTSPVDYLRFAQQAEEIGFRPQYVGVGLTVGFDAVLEVGCGGRDGGWVDGGRFLSPVPGLDHAPPEFLQAGRDFGAPTDDVALALWAMAEQQHELLRRYEAEVGGPLTRGDFRDHVERQRGLRGVLPTANFSPDDHFGGDEIHVIEADCSTRRHRTLETYRSSF